MLAVLLAAFGSACLRRYTQAYPSRVRSLCARRRVHHGVARTANHHCDAVVEGGRWAAAAKVRLVMQLLLHLPPELAATR
eukprot:272868-Chlamydomonas_euryale.AAC.1